MAGWRHGRRALVVIVVALTATALILDPVAREVLSGGRTVDLGLLQLRRTNITCGVVLVIGALLLDSTSKDHTP
ncbi:hypothetical protein ACWDTG_26040 [Rhodococcus zopfii]